MDVIRDERLQENALLVGNFLLEQCEKLKGEFPLVGDVRGVGLFVGLDLVRDRRTRSPATAEARLIVSRMKSRHHILISSDGPSDNVLKLKPPMVFNHANAVEFLYAIRECLEFVSVEGVTESGHNGFPASTLENGSRTNGTTTNGTTTNGTTTNGTTTNGSSRN